MNPCKKFLVAGNGRVGSFISRYLNDAGYDVTVIDLDVPEDDPVARDGIYYEIIDCTDRDVVLEFVDQIGFDVIISAVPGPIGYKVLNNLIASSCNNIVDISFMPEDFRDLSTLAQERGVRIVADCGVMPGLGSMMIAHAKRAHIPDANRAAVYVGGLPESKGYSAPFSPVDVIAEYTRPARYKHNGIIKEYDPLDNIFNAGTRFVGKDDQFECIISDGLRSMLSLDIDTICEFTVRHPGHLQEMQTLRKYGVFDDLKVAERLLLPVWQLKKGEREFTIMNVHINAEHHQYIYRLYDQTAENGDSSMARTTGLPAVVVAERMIKDPGVFLPGVSAPEDVDFMCNEIIATMKENDIIIEEEMV